jgi:hypothetical protein
MAKFTDAKGTVWTIAGEPENFHGKLYMDGKLVWECGHVHESRVDAVGCARRKFKGLIKHG